MSLRIRARRFAMVRALAMATMIATGLAAAPAMAGGEPSQWHFGGGFGIGIGVPLVGIRPRLCKNAFKDEVWVVAECFYIRRCDQTEIAIRLRSPPSIA